MTIGPTANDLLLQRLKAENENKFNETFGPKPECTCLACFNLWQLRGQQKQVAQWEGIENDPDWSGYPKEIEESIVIWSKEKDRFHSGRAIPVPSKIERVRVFVETEIKKIAEDNSSDPWDAGRHSALLSVLELLDSTDGM